MVVRRMVWIDLTALSAFAGGVFELQGGMADMVTLGQHGTAAAADLLALRGRNVGNLNMRA
jgi:hypothetical protein